MSQRAVADRLQPALLCLEVTVPRMDGIEATGRIEHDHPGVVVLGLSVRAESNLESSGMESYR